MKRNTILDILKGLGILLVVIGHNISGNSLLFKYIYSFHMPLFFLISGYLYTYNKSNREYIKRKIRSLIIPFIYFSIISIILYNMFIDRNVNVIGTFFFSNSVGMSIVNYNAPLWFLPALFIDECFFNSLKKYVKNDFIIFIIILILSFIGLCIPENRFIIFTLNHSLYYLLYFYIGYLAKKINLINKMQNHKLSYISIMTISILLSASIFSKYNLIVSNYLLKYIISLFYAFSGIITFYFVSKLISKIYIVKKIFIYFGMNTLLIMCLHMLVKQYIFGGIMLYLPSIEISNNLNIIINIFFSLVLSIPFILLINRKFPWLLGKKV